MKEYQPIGQTVQKLKRIFTPGGLKLHERRVPGTSILKYRAVFLLNSIWYGLSCLGMFFWLIIGLIRVQKRSFTELSFVAPCLACNVLGISKSVCYTFYDTEAYNLVTGLMELEDTRHASDQIEERKIKGDEYYRLNVVLNAGLFMYVLAIISFNGGPLIGTAVIYYRTENLKLFLPIFDIYPFDAQNIIYWPYAYIHQFWTMFLTLFFVGSIDSFLLTCCSYIRIHFRMLQLDIVNMIPEGEILLTSGVRSDLHIKQTLHQLIRRHQEIIRLAIILRKIYSASFLVNVVTNSVIICLTGFNVMVIRDINLVISSVSFLITNLLLTFFLCYFGDLLMSASEEISTAVYASRWYLGDMETAKKLHILLARAQTPCTLTAAGFVKINLRAFMKILSTSWSYFALLQTIYDETNN